MDGVGRGGEISLLHGRRGFIRLFQDGTGPRVLVLTWDHCVRGNLLLLLGGHATRLHLGVACLCVT